MDSENRISKEPYQENWETYRGKGKWKFILAYGVIGWGLGVAVLMSLLEVGIGLFDGSIDWGLIGTYFIGFPISGTVFGLWYWWFNEKKYRKMMARRKE